MPVADIILGPLESAHTFTRFQIRFHLFKYSQSVAGKAKRPRLIETQTKNLDKGHVVVNQDANHPSHDACRTIFLVPLESEQSFDHINSFIFNSSHDWWQESADVNGNSNENCTKSRALPPLCMLVDSAHGLGGGGGVRDTGFREHRLE
jgi:hypothetical protein